MAKSRLCSIPGCRKPHEAFGYCSVHYMRWKRWGDPLFTRQRSPGTALNYLQETVLKYEGDDCLIWPLNRDRNGYGQMSFKGAKRNVHRIVCEALYGPAPSPSHEAAHTCGKGLAGCVNPRHVRWATRVENKADMVKHGTAPRGERHGQSKLTKSQALEIRASDESAYVIAKRIGVSPSTIHRVRSRETWAWL